MVFRHLNEKKEDLLNQLYMYFKLTVSVKYSCGFPDPQVFPIIVVDRYLDYFTTIMEDRLWEVLAKPVSLSEQIRLINECRQSGMTDADWCRENDIAVSTFYNWVSRCRKAAANQIPAANYGHLEVPRPKQDVVPIDIVPDHIPEQHTASRMLNSHLDNSHTIEVAMKDITVRISNDADPVLLTRTFRLLQELSC